MRKKKPHRKKWERYQAEGTVWVNARGGKELGMFKDCKGEADMAER